MNTFTNQLKFLNACFQKMSLWDPEAAGNAAVFLRLSDMAMLEIRNAPFIGKLNLSLIIFWKEYKFQAFFMKRKKTNRVC